MRKDIEGWEAYQALLDKVIGTALRWQDRHNHPRLPVMTLLTVAETQATEPGPRALALQYGDVNQAVLPLISPDGTAFKDATKDIGPLGVLVFQAARAMVVDAQRDPKWVAYCKEHKRTWTRPTPCE